MRDERIQKVLAAQGVCSRRAAEQLIAQGRVKLNGRPVGLGDKMDTAADVLSVEIHEEGKTCRVVVPDDQLSLAIGKEGQNARLAAKLTGWKIDIKPASAPADEVPEEEEDVILEDETETQSEE